MVDQLNIMIGAEHLAVFGFMKFFFLIFFFKMIFFSPFAYRRRQFGSYYRQSTPSRVNRRSSWETQGSNQDSVSQETYRPATRSPRRVQYQVEPTIDEIKAQQSDVASNVSDQSTTVTVYCVECGLNIKDQYKYCPSCGSSNVMLR